MGLVLVTPPSAEPVTLQEAKTFCRVSHGLEDGVFDTLIEAARIAAEAYTWRQIMPAQWRLTLGCFDAACVELPRPALRSVASVRYYDANGDQQTLSTDYYWTDTTTTPGRVVLKPSYSWPTTQDGRPDAVWIDYNAGYESAAAVPGGLKTAILLLVAHIYEHREAVALMQAGEVPLSLRFFLSHYCMGKV